MVDSSRYPPHLSEAGFMQPCPRRIRAMPRRRHRARHAARLLRLGGAALPRLLRAGRGRRPGAGRAAESTQTFESGPFAGLVHVDWDAVDAWFEEDEEVFGGHPRSPYARVDAIRSSRHIRVELDGVVLAETRRAGDALRDRPADPPLHPAHRRRLRPPRAHRHRHLLPVQGDDQRLLVGAGRRRCCTRHRLVLRLSRSSRCCRSPGWSPSTTRRSTPSSTASR